MAQCRNRAAAIAAPVSEFIARHSTVSVERSVLRLLGVDGVGEEEAPVPNLIVDALSAEQRSAGVATAFGRVLAQTGLSAADAGRRLAAADLTLSQFDDVPDAAAVEVVTRAARAALEVIARRRDERAERLQRLPQTEPPLLYVIVASGNIYEDRTAAVAAAQAGAQIVAVIRSTGQSLLDFVPFGATTEGFGGTYATQANFNIMREALDEVSERLGRYVMLTNYASGLCMPEIATMAAIERLDMLLNDSMYGILFRDINMKRTFVDQHFSRMLNAYSGIIINTGEDNYLTTADAVEQAPAVLASQFINEEFAHRAGMPDRQIGLGDAYEISPDLQDGFLFQVAQAQLARQIFPDAPLKYMPPTKHMTGDIFKGHLIDALFNLTSVMTGQTIHLCGMLTEAIHTPFLGDRALALENAQYVMNTARHFGDEIAFKPGGRIETRAQDVLGGCLDLLERVSRQGLMNAIEHGVFADVKRPSEGGRGFDGVFERSPDYWNPFEELLVIKPYGDTLNDGKVQLSFTLPVSWSEAADEAARQLVVKMGFSDVAVAEGRPIAEGFSFFVVYASTPQAIDISTISTASSRTHAMSMEEIDALIAQRIGRKIRIAGACIGTDAHTVGIDAILNMKGYKGDYGLERYKMFETFNLGSQVSVEEFVRFAKQNRIDALLASQVVTQKGSDVKNFTALAELLEAEGLRDRVVLCCGGPRVTNLLALELGYDAGFGRGTLPSEVAAFIATRLSQAERV